MVSLLRFAHANRDDWQDLGFSSSPNIPNAQRVPFRTRGSNVGSRECMCRSPDQCESDNLCTLNPIELTGLDTPVCTPRQPRNGFRGSPQSWDEPNNRPLLSQYSSAASAGPAASAVSGKYYVRRWRVLDGIEEVDNESSSATQ